MSLRTATPFCVTTSFLAILVLVAVARPGLAEIVVLDFENAEPVDFSTVPYAEDGFLAEVESGHYELLADADPTFDGDLAFHVDEQQLGLTQVRLRAEDGRPFDLLSLEVVNPASAMGEVAISAVGGAGSVSAPTVAGPFAPGPGFQGITALVITQNAPGAFSIDDVTVDVMPEPAQLPSLAALSLVVLLLARRRAR
jgi:hypothetical protein